MTPILNAVLLTPAFASTKTKLPGQTDRVPSNKSALHFFTQTRATLGSLKSSKIEIIRLCVDQRSFESSRKTIVFFSFVLSRNQNKLSTASACARFTNITGWRGMWCNFLEGLGEKPRKIVLLTTSVKRLRATLPTSTALVYKLSFTSKRSFQIHLVCTFTD